MEMRRIIDGFVLLIIVLFIYSSALAASYNSFNILPLSDDDKKSIVAVLKPYKSRWVSQDALEKHKMPYWRDNMQKQSFRILSSQKGLEDVYFVSIQADLIENLEASDRLWDNSVSFIVIDRKNNTIRLLPAHPARQWIAFRINSIAFRDVQGNGQRAIVINVASTTGIGVGGATPFDVYGIYLPNSDGSWHLDDKLQDRIEKMLYEKCNSDKCRSLANVLKEARDYFKRK